MKQKPPKKRSFPKQVIALALLSCIASVLILGIAQILLSASYFSRQAKSDLRFYLENTNLQFDTKVKNLENMVIALSSNRTIEQFLKSDSYDLAQVKDQFGSIADLFSENNMVSSVHPFISRIYLFNPAGRMVSSQFYPCTVNEQEMQNQLFKELNARFLAADQEYLYLSAQEQSFLCTHIYDERMEKVGSCVLSIEVDAVQAIYEESTLYPDQLWQITGADGEVLFANDAARESPGLFEPPEASNRLTHRPQYLTDSLRSGFGLTAHLMVARHAIYQASISILLPFALIFVLVIGIAGTVVLICALRITKPIKLMGEDIRQFSSGNTHGKMREFEIQEFDEVSRLYNEMTSQIQSLIARVYEEQLLAAQAQLKYLQSQINPHFMFNILSMLSMRAGLNGDRELQKLLSAFAKLVQGKIFRKGETRIPLSEELELTEFYLLLQSERFGGQITYDIRCDEQVKDAKIPRLLVEPLVENAVAHGLEPKPDKGHVLVTAQEQDGMLRIQVEDNGIGFSTSELADRQQSAADEKHTHIGLENTRQTLQVVYGEQASMNIESEPGKGTCITIRLPLERTIEHVERNDRG